MELPSPEAVLAMRAPTELFGDAIGERRALKRAYTTLIRAYSPESHPDVFAHIRRLFELARDGGRVLAFPVVAAQSRAPEPTPAADEVHGDGEEPAPSAPSRPALAAPPRSEDPVAAIVELAEHQEWTAVARRLIDDAALRSGRPDVWVGMAREVLGPAAFRLPRSAVEGVIDAVGSLSFEVDPRVVLQLQSFGAAALAWHDARADDEVSSHIVDALTWYGRDLVDVARRWQRLGTELGGATEGRRAFAQLLDRHPGLQVPLFTLEVNMTGWMVDLHKVNQGEPLAEVRQRLLEADPEAELKLGPHQVVGELEVAGPDGESLVGGSGRGWKLGGLALVAAFIVVLMASLAAQGEVDGVEVLLLRAGLALVAGAWMIVFFQPEPPSREPPTARSRGALAEALCRDCVLFPHELVLALAAHEPAPAMFGEDAFRPFPDDHVLLVMEQDRSVLTRVLTDAHIERIAARLAQPEPEPSA